MGLNEPGARNWIGNTMLKKQRITGAQRSQKKKSIVPVHSTL